MVELLLKKNNLLEIDDNFLRYINPYFVPRYSLCTSQHCSVLIWRQNWRAAMPCVVSSQVHKSRNFFLCQWGCVYRRHLKPLPTTAPCVICTSCRFNFHSPGCWLWLRRGFAVGRTDGQDAQWLQHDEGLGHPHAATARAEAARAGEAPQLHPKVWPLPVLSPSVSSKICITNFWQQNFWNLTRLFFF